MKIGIDWTPLEVASAPRGVLCRFKCELTGARLTGYFEDMHFQKPEYVWWVLTGLACEGYGDRR